MVYWKYSASTRTSTEYMYFDAEYEYLCSQWSEYEYELIKRLKSPPQFSIWYIRNLNYFMNITGMVYWKYSASTRTSTEYMYFDAEYEYLCSQWSEYEYEYWN